MKPAAKKPATESPRRPSARPAPVTQGKTEPKPTEQPAGAAGNATEADAPPTLRQMQARACGSKTGNARVVCQQRERFRFCRGKYGQHEDCPAQATRQ